jgi:hypothetical protein
VATPWIAQQEKRMSRLDRLGRRIGHNWWREHIVNVWFSADQAWQLACEVIAIGYAEEERQYAEQNPRPTLKQSMIANANPMRECQERQQDE